MKSKLPVLPLVSGQALADPATLPTDHPGAPDTAGEFLGLLRGDSGDSEKSGDDLVNEMQPEVTRDLGRQRFLEDFSAANLYAAFETASLPEGDVGNFFQFPLTLVGGANLDSSALVRGALPPGLFLANNVISGTPTTGGIYSFVLEANSTETIGGVDRTIEGLTEFTLTISPTP